MEGWIKISRGIKKHWVYQDAVTFKWWFDMITEAFYETKKIRVGTHFITVERGQLLASSAYLQKRWGRSRTMVENFLRLLQEDGMITRMVKHNQGIIQIVNWDKYQYNVSAYLEDGLSECESESCEDGECSTEAYPKADLRADLEACPKADLRAPNKEYKERKEYNSPDGENACAREERIDWKEVVDTWHRFGPSLKRISQLTDKRKEKIRLRLKEMGGLDKFATVVACMEATPFLRKPNVGNIDWLCKNSENWLKVLEGVYEDNKQEKITTNGNDPKRSGAVAQSSTEFQRSF